jgi:predicted Ser/Thr protein kinase
MSPTLHLKNFGKYEIIRKLGRSMTDVYLALDPEHNRRVVLKIVEHSHDAFTQVVMDAERRGAVIQEQLHGLDPRILGVYEYGEQNGCFFIAMEYVEGKSLADILRAEQRLDPMRAARYAIEICSQLQTLHTFQADIDGRKRAVVHGDVKPSNIQIGPNGEVRLLDFGIAKSITSTHNLTHHNLGSPAYCSPERVTNVQVDQHADLWGLGVTLYEMIAGLPPYQAQNTRKLENLIQSRRPPRALPQSCPPALKQVISKALAADLAHRYESAAAFQEDLERFLTNSPTVAEVDGKPAWDANETVQKTPAASRPAAADSVRRNERLDRILINVQRIVLTLVAGFLVGLLLFVPAAYLYRGWTQSAPLRTQRDYVRRTLPEIAADWQLYTWLKKQNHLFARISPVAPTTRSLHANFVAAAGEIIERYRNSSDPAIDNFDWTKAQICLKHALELAPGDNESRSRLALCNGYIQLIRSPGSLEAAQSAKASFEQAVSYNPKALDPHLGLARVYIYSFHNIGMALAELYEAERLGFQQGPREFEQQGDAYLYRAEREIRQAKRSKQMEAHYLSLAQHDLARARNLYEPINGFSNVSLHLQRVDSDEAAAKKITVPVRRAKPRGRPRYQHARYVR